MVYPNKHVALHPHGCWAPWTWMQGSVKTTLHCQLLSCDRAQDTGQALCSADTGLRARAGRRL